MHHGTAERSSFEIPSHPYRRPRGNVLRSFITPLSPDVANLISLTHQTTLPSSHHLVTRPPRIGNHPLQLIDLPLRTAEGSELSEPQPSFISHPTQDLIFQSRAPSPNHRADVQQAGPNQGKQGNKQEDQGGGKTYTLLSQLASTLVFAVAQEFDDAALVGGESVVEARQSVSTASGSRDGSTRARGRETMAVSSCKEGHRRQS